MLNQIIMSQPLKLVKFSISHIVSQTTETNLHCSDAGVWVVRHSMWYKVTIEKSLR